ncbi:hypothetical protein K440DRAFT_628227 [Wilcoxina mikolae CBS 423.85]|nr:hypothetical protein K440DRAFT_628227 [Wilcoxina mikolae CBS 423.85]
MVKILEREIPGFTMQRSSARCILEKLKQILKGYRVIVRKKDGKPVYAPKKKFKDSLIATYQDHSPQLFAGEDEVSAMWVFPLIDKMMGEIKGFLSSDTGNDESTKKVLSRSEEMLKEYHAELRQSPVYYISLFLNPRYTTIGNRNGLPSRKQSCKGYGPNTRPPTSQRNPHNPPVPHLQTSRDRKRIQTSTKTSGSATPSTPKNRTKSLLPPSGSHFTLHSATTPPPLPPSKSMTSYSGTPPNPASQ